MPEPARPSRRDVVRQTLTRLRPPWAVLYVGVVAAMAALWALAGPIASVPDEPAHVVKAASIWQGQLSGPTEPLDPERLPLDITAQVLRTPESYRQVDELACFAFRPEVPATCQPTLGDDDTVVLKKSAAGPYPPSFYALVGWPTRIVPAGSGVYLMRLTSVALCVALVALALASLRRVAGDALAFTAVTAAITPEVLYLAGSVNPNGLEIVGGLALWAGLTAVVRHRLRTRPVRRLDVVTTVAGAAALALTRSLGPLFTLAVVAAVLVAHGRGVIALRRDRAVLGVIAAIGAIVVVGSAWVVTSGHLGSVPGARPEPGRSIAEQLVARTDDWAEQMVAVFGWLDTGPVQLAVWSWLAILAVLVGGVWLLVRSWLGIAAVLLVPIVALTPVVLQYPGADDQGIAWQGRYALALAVGIPVLAAVALADAGVPELIGRRLAVLVGALAAVAHIASFATAMRRYAVGLDGALRFWQADAAWAPPLGNLLTLVLFVVAALALVPLALRPSRP